MLTRWLCGIVLAISAGVSLWSMERLPDAALLPAVLGLIPFAVGKYLLCPLRWHALSVSGRSRWWHIRAYAESELLGLASPAHSGADIWRVHCLHRAGMGRTAAAAEAALDRLVGMAGIAVGIALAGVALPVEVLLACAGIGAATLLVAVGVRVRRPDLFARRPLPSGPVFVLGVLLSLAYQASIAGLIFGAILASWTEALGAVALIAVLPWLPALLFGGGSLAARRIDSSRSGYTTRRDAVTELRAVA